MNQIIVFTLLFFATLSTQASIRQYSADLGNSKWELSNNSRLQCSLTHNIPNYGQATFFSRASREINMEFELDMMRLPDTYALAELRSEAPSWRPGVNGHILAKMKLHKQYSPSLPKKVAWTMLNELAQGMSPTFYYNDWYSDTDKISVGLSTAKFSGAYQEFVSCIGNLLTYNFDDIAYTVLHYQSNSDNLTKSSIKRMSMITEYLALDPSLELVLIDAYSDSYGGRDTNQRLSVKRANKIREFFVKSGIETSRIEAKGYGEKRHIASNDTVLGREENRRVVVRMELP